MAGEITEPAVAGHEANGDRAASPAELTGAAAVLAVEGAVAAGADPGAEEVPDVEHHPWIQPTHTMGDYYPMTHRII